MSVKDYRGVMPARHRKANRSKKANVVVHGRPVARILKDPRRGDKDGRRGDSRARYRFIPDRSEPTPSPCLDGVILVQRQDPAIPSQAVQLLNIVESRVGRSPVFG